MTELAEQLARYIDSVAEPVGLEEISTRSARTGSVVVGPLQEVRAGHGTVSRARRRVGLGLSAGVLTRVLVAVVAVLLHTEHDSSAPARPAGTLGTAMEPQGPADCSAVTKPGDTVLLAVMVQGGHAVCVTSADHDWSFFLDGRPGGTASGMDARSSYFGAIGTADGKYVMLGNLLDLPKGGETVRLTSCRGASSSSNP